jgi:hypothetical protein
MVLSGLTGSKTGAIFQFAHFKSFYKKIKIIQHIAMET